MLKQKERIKRLTQGAAYGLQRKSLELLTRAVDVLENFEGASTFREDDSHVFEYVQSLVAVAAEARAQAREILKGGSRWLDD